MNMMSQLALFGMPRADRSPLDMPPARIRNILTAAVVQIRAYGGECAHGPAHQRSMCDEIAAIADALESIADGQTAAACQAVEEAGAEMMKRIAK